MIRIPEVGAIYKDSDKILYEIVCLANYKSEPVVVYKGLRNNIKIVDHLEDFNKNFELFRSNVWVSDY